MKSKKALVFVAMLGLIVGFFAYQRFTSTPFFKALPIEWIENIDTVTKNDTNEGGTWEIIPFGYTLGAWPVYFQGEPIVTKMTYQKGPPVKFIQSMTQLWRPVEIELTLEGPHTPNPKLKMMDWKNCFSSSMLCKGDKKDFLKAVTQSYPAFRTRKEAEVTWFDSLDPLGVRGVHFHLDAKTYSVDQYTILTDSGIAQSFILKYVNNPVGLEARSTFGRVLSGLKVKEDLGSARAWIQNKIEGVKLDQIRSVQSAKLRMVRMIQVQNWIFSLLSVDPSSVMPFFHLGGVTHMLAIELLKVEQKGNEKLFENQEAWALNSKPLLDTLLAYVKDFPESTERTNAVKNLEALLQDLLLIQQKMTGGAIK
jgi:hypothetical protein